MSRPDAQIQTFLRYRGDIGVNPTHSNTLVPDEIEPLKRVHLESDCYVYDHVFDRHSTQDHVYEKVVHPVLQDVMNGLNCTIFAYGQTGTGKTYTMEGELDETQDLSKRNAGIIPRTIKKIFELMDKNDTENHVEISMLELYNEEVRDLLCEPSQQRPLAIVETKKTDTFQAADKKKIPVFSVDKGLSVMKEGIKRRMTAATQINDKSSRSHCIFTITVYLHQGDNENGGFQVGKLNLVDLAGSENSRTSGSNKARFREGTKINASLLTLGRVIEALASKRPHVPYRESKLTKLLKDSLGGRTKTYVIATICPEQQNRAELKNTLEYATKARIITNKQQANRQVLQDIRVRQLIEANGNLERSLRAHQEKDGVYTPKTDYDAMIDESKRVKEELLAKDIMLEDYKKASIQQKEDYTKALIQQKEELLAKDMLLQDYKMALIQQKEDYTKALIQQKEENKTIREEGTLKIEAVEHEAQVREEKLKEDLRASKGTYRRGLEFIQNFCWDELDKHHASTKAGLRTDTYRYNSVEALPPVVQGEDLTMDDISKPFESIKVVPIAKDADHKILGCKTNQIKLSSKRSREDDLDLPEPTKKLQRKSVEKSNGTLKVSKQKLSASNFKSGKRI